MHLLKTVLDLNERKTLKEGSKMIKREWWKENVKSKERSKRNEARLGETSKEIESGRVTKQKGRNGWNK